MNRYILILVLLTVLIPLSVSAEEASTVDFTLEDLDGELFTLSEHIGSGPVVIDFWATWCKPCKDTMPHLQKLHEKYNEQGLTVIAVSTDSPKSQSKVKPFIRSRRYTYTVLFDPNSEVLKLFQGCNLPYRVLIDKNGEVVETHMGYSPGDEKILEEKIKEMLTPSEQQ